MKKIITLVVLIIFLIPQTAMADAFNSFKEALNCFNGVANKKFEVFAKNDGYIQLQLKFIKDGTWAVERQKKIDGAMKAFKVGFDAAINGQLIDDYRYWGAYQVNRIVSQILCIYPQGTKMTLMEQKGSKLFIKATYGDKKPWLIVTDEIRWIQIDDTKANAALKEVGREYYSKVKAKEIYFTLTKKHPGTDNVYEVVFAVDINGKKYKPMMNMYMPCLIYGKYIKEEIESTNASPTKSSLKDNDIAGFKIISQDPQDMIIDVSYKYSGEFGEKVILGAAPLQDKKMSTLFSYVPARAIAGNNRATIKISLKKSDSIRDMEIKTNGIRIVMFVRGQKTAIVAKEFPWVKKWKREE